MAPNSTLPRLVNSQLVSLPPVGILNFLCLICIIFVCDAHLIIFTKNLRDINVNFFFFYLFAISARLAGDKRTKYSVLETIDYPDRKKPRTAEYKSILNFNYNTIAKK